MLVTTLKRRLRPALLAGVALLVMLAATPARLALAAPANQDEGTPLLLGEFGSAAMSAGDRADFAITLPFDGAYLVIYTGDGDPAALALLVVDGEGNEAFNGTMEDEVPLELAAGPYQLSFEAQSDVDLSFVVGTESGSMTADIFEPGELINGGSYYEENVDAERYAVLTIEPSSYPQKAVILLQGDEGDVYEVEVFSEDGGYFWSSTDVSDIVSFPTTGGAYDVTVTPLEGGASMRVTVFLSGPAPLLNPDEPMDGELADSEDVATYQFTVNNAGAVVTVKAESGNGNSVDLAAGLLPDDDTWSTYSFGEPAALEFIAPIAGTYFINIATDNTDGDTYTIVASEGDVVPSLPINEPVVGKVAEGAATGYLLEVTEPDEFVVVVLAGPDEEDLDLSIERFEADGSRGLSDSTYTAGSKEIVGVFSAEPGTFIVTIDASYASDTDYVVLATLGSLEELLSMPEDAAAVEEAPLEEATPAPESGKKGETEVVPPEVATPTPEEEALIEQWAVAAVASSEYTDGAWSAQQMVGEPDTPEAGDFETAWAAAYADTQLETVTLTFATAVVPTAVEIYESYNPGAVALIEVLDLNTDEWVAVWEGAAGPTGEELAVFSPPLDAAGLVTDQVRITLDEPAVEGWNEIDAVKLIGVAE